jgi:hypothetical protein
MSGNDAPATPEATGSAPPASAPASGHPGGPEPGGAASGSASALTSAPLGPRLGPVVLIVCGAVLVAMTVGWLLAQHGGLSPGGPTGAEIAALRTQLAAQESRVAALSAQVEALAGRPVADSAPLAAQLSALSQRVAALEARPAGGDTSALAASVAALAQKLASVAQAGQDATQRLARIEAARAALDAGQPLGVIPGAPPALARYATTAPPTTAGLRESFDPAAAAALKASRPPEPASLPARLLQRAESLLTVRVGGKVVAGPPASVPLDAARRRLDTGDLAGAVAALAPLDAAAANAMAPWTGEARALLEARAALNALAKGGASAG